MRLRCEVAKTYVSDEASLVRHQSGEQPTTLGSKYFRHLWLFATFGGEQEEMVRYPW